MVKNTWPILFLRESERGPDRRRREKGGGGVLSDWMGCVIP